MWEGVSAQKTSEAANRKLRRVLKRSGERCSNPMDGALP